MEQAEIRGRLTLDDAASGALEHIGHGLEHVEHKVGHVTGELRGMLKQAVATALGFQFDRGIHTIKEIGEEAFTAAKAVGAQEKALTGMLMMVDKTGASYATLKQQGVELKDELEDMAIDMGAGVDKVIDVFGDIAARTNKSTDRIKEMVEQMVNVGKVAPGGLDALASGMMQVEMGITRARNPVVQFIAQTDTLSTHLHKAHMNAKEVAAYMTKLAPESQMKLAEEAIRRMNERTKEIPLSFGQLVQSAKDIREQFFEKLGVPILREALTPAMRDMQGWLHQHREEIEHLGTNIGKKVAAWIKDLSAMLKDAFRYVEQHADEIKNAIVEGAEALKTAVKFVVDHKEAIAALVAARTIQTSVVPRAMALAEQASPLAKGAAAAAGTIWDLIKEGAPGMGIESRNKPGYSIQRAEDIAQAYGHKGWHGLGPEAPPASAFVPLAATVAAFGAAVLAWRAAIDQWQHLMAETKGGTSKGLQDYTAELDAMQKLQRKTIWSDDDVKFYEKMRENLAKNAEAAGQSARATNEMSDAIWRQHMAAKGMVQQFDQLEQHADEGFTRIHGEGFVGTGEEPEDMNIFSEQWIEAFNVAKRQGNEALLDYATTILARSSSLQDGLLIAKTKIEGGFEALADMMANKSEDYAKILRTMRPDEALKDGASKPLHLNFNHNTFNLKQDFRDKDPDKIMMMFKNDVAKAALFRTGSKLNSPFGM